MYKLTADFDFKGYRGSVEYKNGIYYCVVNGVEEIKVEDEEYSQLLRKFNESIIVYLNKCKENNIRPKTTIYYEIANYYYNFKDEKTQKNISGTLIAVSEEDVYDYLFENFNIKKNDLIAFPMVSRTDQFSSTFTKRAKTFIINNLTN